MMRKKFEAGFKAKVAMEAFRGEKTMAELSSEYGVHANMISRWKQELLEGAAGIFNGKHVKVDPVQEEKADKLYKSIGELKVENDWLKKKLGSFTLKDRISLIDKEDEMFSQRKQSLLLDINWSTLYYKPVGIRPRDREMMNLLDEEYTKYPFYGVRKMKKYLRDQGYNVGNCHVRTLLRNMGLFAVFAKPNLSKPHPEHKIYPYLLKDVEIKRPNQVWSTDITYIRLGQGFAYLTAIIDWHSRCVLSWRISNTLESIFCVDALEEAIRNYGCPEIFNTDQGSQFTSDDFIGVLTVPGRNISISMDGKGRAHDNIFVERLWRSVKYEDIYLKGYQNIPEAREGLRKYFEFYNHVRYHESLDYATPWQIYSGSCNIFTAVARVA
ncbi:MAG: IS3 family transposase [Syntrophus sp. (in: bacteria)]|nr:IS3 family transposase [Syntrophus sp. (in: bacteria)]